MKIYFRNSLVLQRFEDLHLAKAGSNLCDTLEKDSLEGIFVSSSPIPYELDRGTISLSKKLELFEVSLELVEADVAHFIKVRQWFLLTMI